MKENRWGLLKAVLKSTFQHNPSALLIILCIAVFVIMPSVLLNSSRSILQSVTESVAEVYGGFDYIFYADLSSSSEEVQNEINQIESDDSFTDIGRMNIAGVISDGENILHAGYADEDGARLSGIRLVSGHLPEKSGEIAVTETAEEYIQVIEDALGYETDVVGVVADYGRLWPRGKQQNDMSLDNVDVFMYRSDMETLRDKTGVNICLFLLSCDGVTIDTSDRDGMYENYNWKNAQLQNSSFDTPQSFLAISGVVCAFLLLGTMIFSSRSIIRRYRFMWMLGTEWGRARKYYNLELGVYLIIGNAAGLMLGMAGTVLAVRSLGDRLERSIDIQVDILNILMMILANAVIVFVVGNLIFRLKDDRIRDNRIRHRAHKTGYMRLAFLEYKTVPKTFIFSILIVVISAFFVIYINNYIKNFSAQTAYAGGYDGEMPMNYDFELLAKNKSYDGTEEGDISYIYTYEKNGIVTDDLQRFAETEGVGQVNAYKITDKILILKDADSFDEYLDISDTYLDGQYSIKTLGGQMFVPGHDELLRIVGYQDNTIIQTVMKGYPASDMQFLGDYVTEGTIDIEKLNSGEEIILMVPACIYEEYGVGRDGEPPSRGQGYVNYTDENAINDTLFHVGDEITVSEYRVLTEINSGINEEEARNLIERRDHTVRIGAIIRSYAGWFDHVDEVQFQPVTYTLITSCEAFEALDIDSTYTRVRIFADEDADMDSLRTEISNLASEYPNMTSRDISSQLVSYHELNLLVSMACMLLKYLVIVLGCISVVLQMITKTKTNRENYMLYRMNGLCFRDIILIFLIQMVITIAISVALMCILCLIVTGNMDLIAEAENISAIALYLLIVLVCSVVGSGIVTVTSLNK